MGGVVIAASTSQRLLIVLSRWRVQLGFCFATAALLLARPTWHSYLEFLPMLLAGASLRVWARGHLDRAERVCWGGPYRLVRHPLYVGSFLMGLGVALMALSPGGVMGYVVVFLAMYVPKALREEAYLRHRFGDGYAAYAAAVPAALPSLSRAVAEPPSSRFEWRRVWRHREWRTWIGIAVVLVCVWVPELLWP
jgi:protein-S-isoprenylcysteine O-methyltransferase Ste14